MNNIPFFFPSFDHTRACNALTKCLPGTWLCRPSTSIHDAIVFAVKLSKDQWREHYPDNYNEEMVAEYQAVPSCNGRYRISNTTYECTLQEVPSKFNFFTKGFTGTEHYQIPVPSNKNNTKQSQGITNGANVTYLSIPFSRVGSD